jgi:hypothetical protein
MAGLKKGSNMLDQGELAASKLAAGSQREPEHAAADAVLLDNSSRMRHRLSTQEMGFVKRTNHNYCMGISFYTFKENQNRLR